MSYRRNGWLRALGAAAIAGLSLGAAAAAHAQSASSTTIRSSLNPSQPGQAVTFTATVAGNGNGAPTGTVTFNDAGNPLSAAVMVQPAGANQTAVAGGWGHTCALTAVGGVKCWGNNEWGQLGDGTTTRRYTPVDGPEIGTAVISVASNYETTCALTAAGGIKCWGYNWAGALGNGSSNLFSATPVNVAGLGSGVTAIGMGRAHGCALTAAGGVKCWGENSDGQLGNNSDIYSNVPVNVVGLASGVIAIAVGGRSSCALTTAGGVKCWGQEAADLACGFLCPSAIPVDVPGLSSGVSAIAAGPHHCVLTTGGGVKCWGQNDHGQLGDNTITYRGTPVDVPGLGSGVAAIVLGEEHTCVLTTSGGVKCWGLNDHGQLGDNSTTDRHLPVDVSGLGSGVAAIAAGTHHTCALSMDGSAKCWGWNQNGSVGDNTFTDRLIPTAVSGFGSGAALVFSKAALTTSVLTAGSHSITAEYSGDGTHTGSTSPALTQSVAAPATATTLTSSDAASAFGQRVTLTAHMTSSGGTPSGSVTFKDGANTLGTKALSGGSAALAVSSLAVGTHHLKAVYGGSASFAASASAALTQKVAKGSSTTGLTTAPQAVTTATTMTLTATVRAKAPARGAPAGSVTFKDGVRILGRRNLARGRAVLKVKLKAGRHRLVASYAGSGQFAPSKSPAKSVTVRQKAAPRLRRGTTFAVADRGAGRGAAGATRAGSPMAARDAQDQSAMARLGDGFVVVWRERDGERSGIYGRRFDAAATPLGERFVIASDMAGVSGPAVASLSDGGFAVAWASGRGVEAQKFGAHGRRRGARLLLARDTSVARPALAGLDGGGFVAAWPANGDVVGQRYDGKGRNAGAWLTIDDAAEPVVAALDDGRFIVAWTRRDDDGSGVYAQRFTAGGDKVGAAMRLNTTVAHDQSQPGLAVLDGGGFAAAWTSEGQDGSGSGIVGRLFDAEGEGGSEFIVNAATQGDQSQPAVLVWANSLVAAWTSVLGNSPPAIEGQSFMMTTSSADIAAQ